MSLEEYKKRAMDYLEKTYPNIIQEEPDFLTMSDKEWRGYMEDFSPEATVEGLLMNLI